MSDITYERKGVGRVGQLPDSLSVCVLLNISLFAQLYRLKIILTMHACIGEWRPEILNVFPLKKLLRLKVMA